MERVLRKEQRKKDQGVWSVPEAVMFSAAMEGELGLPEQCVLMR